MKKSTIILLILLSFILPVIGLGIAFVLLSKSQETDNPATIKLIAYIAIVFQILFIITSIFKFFKGLSTLI